MTHSTDSRPDSDVLDMKEVAARLGTNLDVVHDLARRNALPVPVIRLGKRVYISRRAFDAKLAEQHAHTSAA